MAEILLASTRRQHRGGLQGGSPPCMDILLIIGKICTLSEAFFLNFCVSSWIKIKHKTKILWPSLATE